MRFRVEDVRARFDDAFSVRRGDDLAVAAGIVDEVVRVEEKVEVLGGLRQEERLHAVVLSVISDIFYLKIENAGWKE